MAQCLEEAHYWPLKQEKKSSWAAALLHHNLHCPCSHSAGLSNWSSFGCDEPSSAAGRRRAPDTAAGRRREAAARVGFDECAGLHMWSRQCLGHWKISRPFSSHYMMRSCICSSSCNNVGNSETRVYNTHTHTHTLGKGLNSDEKFIPTKHLKWMYLN